MRIPVACGCAVLSYALSSPPLRGHPAQDCQSIIFFGRWSNSIGSVHLRRYYVSMNNNYLWHLRKNDLCWLNLRFSAPVDVITVDCNKPIMTQHALLTIDNLDVYNTTKWSPTKTFAKQLKNLASCQSFIEQIITLSLSIFFVALWRSNVCKEVRINNRGLKNEWIYIKITSS